MCSKSIKAAGVSNKDREASPKNIPLIIASIETGQEFFLLPERGRERGGRGERLTSVKGYRLLLLLSSLLGRELCYRGRFNLVDHLVSHLLGDLLSGSS